MNLGLKVSVGKWGMAVMALLVFISCKRVQDKPLETSTTSTSVPKKALRTPPDIQIPEPISVGHARASLLIMEILPLEPSAGPCGKVPCRALAKVTQVHGFGSSFTSALAVGQLVEIFFPMTMADSTRTTALSPGDGIVAELQNPLLGSAVFVVSKFSRP